MKTILAVLALCGGLLAYAQAPASHPKAAGSRTAAPAVRPSLLNPASLHAHAPAVFKAKFTTTAGDFIVEVHRDWAPARRGSLL